MNKNDKIGLIYITNKSFSKEKSSTTFDNYTIGSWCKINNIDLKQLDLREGTYLHIAPNGLHNISADVFIKERKQYLAEHSVNYILINSLYDIHYKIKNALHFIDKLCNPDKFYKKDYNIHIYVLSLDPYREVTDYLYRSGSEYSLMEHHGLFELTTPRNHTRNNALWNYLEKLRMGDDPVSYAELSQASGLNHSTIQTHMERYIKKYMIKNKHGRNLTEEEKEEIFFLKEYEEKI